MAGSGEHGHTMGVVTRRTGLSAHVIRVWERRYGAVTPDRSGTNRRLYSDADIERLRLLHLATRAGHSIGRIADLSDDRLAELLRQDTHAESVPARAPIASSSELIVGGMDAVRRLDAAGLEKLLSRAAVDMSQQQLLEEIIDPLMQGIGQAWQDGSLRIADEHMATAVVRAFLCGLRDLRQGPTAGPGLVVTTPTGQSHEIGAMMAAVTGTAAGWRSVYLGPDLPADEIAGAARRHGARAVALSLVFPLEDPLIPAELQRLRRGLDDGIQIIAGGRAAPSYRRALSAIGAVVADLGELRDHLIDIAAT
jgi:DNA-binding transcriptional MerR regulator/methylmalonyl-CoA mutase cobalamin-binding subunit